MQTAVMLKFPPTYCSLAQPDLSPQRSELEKGLTPHVIILLQGKKCSGLFVFNLITITCGGAKPRMQRWCASKILEELA